LFAALNISTGEVITECRKRSATPPLMWFAFFKKIDRSGAPSSPRHPRGARHLSAHMAPVVTD
jgi:hypothetical protein